MSHERSGEETPPGAREPSRDALDRRVAELNAKHDSLREQVTHLVALMNALQRSDDSGQPCERFAAEADDEAEEPAPFEKQPDERERQLADDSERRPAAVSRLASLLNQQSELLRQRGSQIESLTAQLKVAQQICEIALSQYREIREERDALKQRLSQLEAKRSAAKPVVIGGVRFASDARPQPSGEAAAAEDASGRAVVAKQTGPTALVNPERRGEFTTLLHIETQIEVRDAVRAVAERFGLRYEALQSPPAGGFPPGGLLVLNLLANTVQPMSMIVTARDVVRGTGAFTYCADAASGMIAGMVDHFRFPFEPDELATGLLQQRGSISRLLLVSENLDLTNEIRRLFDRLLSSTSIALDGRQALDLVGLVRPRRVLVDLALPRGDAMRLVARLRCDPGSAALPVTFLWTPQSDRPDFRPQARAAVQEYSFTLETLCDDIGHVVAGGAAGQASLRKAG